MRFSYIMVLLMSLCLLCACGGDNTSIVPEPIPTPTPTPTPTPEPEPTPTPTPTPTPGPEVGKVQRTVLIYMASDNSLSRFIKDDKQQGNLDELLKGASTQEASFFDNNHIIIFVDDAEESFLPTVYRLKQNGGQGDLEIVKQFEKEVVSTDPTTIQSVVDLVKTSYPAESYGFVYVSHGDGWIPTMAGTLRSINPLRYIGTDQQNGTVKSENAVRTQVAELATVLKSMGQKFEFVFFDACLMLSAEVAYEMRDCTNYLIASPVELPAQAAPYEVILPLMFQPSNVAGQIAEAYYQYYSDSYDDSTDSFSIDEWTGGLAMGVVDCSKMSQLAEKTKECLSETTTDNESLRSAIFAYDRRNSITLHYDFDMVDLMKALMSETNFATWKQAYDAAVILWKTTPRFFSSATGWYSMTNTHGLSHYIPQSQNASSSLDKTYQETAWYKDAGLSKLGW